MSFDAAGAQLEAKAEQIRLQSLCQALAATSGDGSGLSSLVVDLADKQLSDQEIQAHTQRIRTRYLRFVSDFIASEWLTPNVGEWRRLPGTHSQYSYAYDRQHRAACLEARLGFRFADGGTMLFSSGMSAIGCVASTVRFLLRKEAPSVALAASYFETLTLFRLAGFRGNAFRCIGHDAIDEAIANKQIDVLYIESVEYNWDLRAQAWPRILEALRQSSRPPIVVIDETLSPYCPAASAAAHEMKALGVPLVIFVRSGIKLDQQGIEVANVGIVEWSRSSESARFTQQFSDALDACRIVSGSGLSRYSSVCLASHAFLDPGSTQSYSALLARSNGEFRKAVAVTGEIFASKSECEGSAVAMSFFTLRERSAESHAKLAEVITFESARRCLGLVMSGSFGFRDDHFETILPSEQPRVGEPAVGVLKVATGAYMGTRFWKFVDLINEIAEFNSVEEAHRASARRLYAITSH